MNIPNSLKACPNWVCWSALPASKSHSGIKKVPVDPKTGKYAKSNDPQTWSDFDTAVRESAKYSGIGFMFSESPFFGVDIDDCREEIEDYLNGGIDNIIHEIIHCLGSYAEFSQSGNGIHIICRGSLPPGGRRKGKIEMYDNGRFFVMTGKICSDYKDKESDFFYELHDRYAEEMKQEAFICPLCGGRLRHRSGRYGEFFGCENYKTTGWRYTRNIRKKNVN